MFQLAETNVGLMTQPGAGIEAGTLKVIMQFSSINWTKVYYITGTVNRAYLRQNLDVLKNNCKTELIIRIICNTNSLNGT